MCRINILLLQTYISQSPSSGLWDKNVPDTVHSNIRIAHLIYCVYCCSAGSAMKYKVISCSDNCPFFFCFLVLNLHLLLFPNVKGKKSEETMIES